MNAGAIFQVPFINTVVNDSPLICTGNLQYSVVCRAVNLLFRILNQYNGLLGNFDGPSGDLDVPYATW